MADLAYPQHDKTAQWVNQLASDKKAVFDSASEIWTREAPETVRELGGLVEHQKIGMAITHGVESYKKAHGVAPSGAVMDSAIRLALNSVSHNHAHNATSGRAVFDNVSSIQSNAPMVANRAAIVLHNAIGLAIPHAGYVPMTEGLAGKIIVVGHAAGNSVGEYVKNDSLDGLAAGKNFMSAERVVLAESSDQTNYTAKIKHAVGDTDGSPVLPSHTEVLINGIPYGAGLESADVHVATTRLAGSAVLEDGKEYAFSGSLTVETGEVTLTFTPALPQGATVHVVSLLNYEHEKLKDKRPRFLATAKPFPFRAGFMSALFQTSQEAATQFKTEVRLDPASEAMFAMQQQALIERHFNYLHSMYRIAQSYKHVANLNANNRLNARDLSDIWSDVYFKLNEADMQMVSRTSAFGIAALYVGAKGAAHIQSLSREIFEPSGITAAAGIFRLGRLFSKYDVYHAPNLLNETTNSIEMLAVGRSEQTGMNPYIVGDVLAPTFKNLGMTADLMEGATYFSAGAARVNPYQRAAKGAALISVTGLEF